MTIHWETRDLILNTVAKAIIPTHIVVDVGAGIHPQSFFTPTTHIIIEPFLPYIEFKLKENSGIPRKVYLNGTWDKVMPLLPAKSVDTIFALDVIEHFEKEEGKRFLEEAKRIARQQIVIFTPLGLYPQDYDTDNLTDRWGMQGGIWQSHRSGWEPSDFDEDWEIFASKDYHKVDQHDNVLEEPFGAFWAIKTLKKQPAPLDERLFVSEIFFYPLAKSIMIIKFILKKVLLKIKG